MLIFCSLEADWLVLVIIAYLKIQNKVSNVTLFNHYLIFLHECIALRKTEKTTDNDRAIFLLLIVLSWQVCENHSQNEGIGLNISKIMCRTSQHFQCLAG
jgi:hypothetical protein